MGLANSPTRLAIKKLIISNKHDFCFIVEAWMDSHSFSKDWLARLDLKIFVVNSKPKLLPNLWCLCLTHLILIIVSINDQQVSFTIIEDEKTFSIYAVYAFIL